MSTIKEPWKPFGIRCKRVVENDDKKWACDSVDTYDHDNSMGTFDWVSVHGDVETLLSRSGTDFFPKGFGDDFDNITGKRFACKEGVNPSGGEWRLECTI